MDLHNSLEMELPEHTNSGLLNIFQEFWAHYCGTTAVVIEFDKHPEKEERQNAIFMEHMRCSIFSRKSVKHFTFGTKDGDIESTEDQKAKKIFHP